MQKFNWKKFSEQKPVEPGIYPVVVQEKMTSTRKFYAGYWTGETFYLSNYSMYWSVIYWDDMPVIPED